MESTSRDDETEVAQVTPAESKLWQTNKRTVKCKLVSSSACQTSLNCPTEPTAYLESNKQTAAQMLLSKVQLLDCFFIQTIISFVIDYINKLF